LKNAHLLRFAHPSSLRRTGLYASFLGISHALHLGMLSQPVNIGFFNTLKHPEFPLHFRAFRHTKKPCFRGVAKAVGWKTIAALPVPRPGLTMARS